MNHRLPVGVLIVGATLGFCIFLFLNFNKGIQNSDDVATSSTPIKAAAPTTSTIPPEALQEIRDSFEKWGKRMESAGVKVMASPVERLRNAVVGGENEEILRAFHDVVYSRHKADEVISALKEFLDNPDPYVRYEASKSLYIVGDRSGYLNMIGLIESDDPIMGIEHDLRFQAAQVLGKFRERNAAKSIFQLYLRTNDRRLANALTKLDASEAKSIIGANGFFEDSSSIEYYALTDTQKFVPKIAAAFRENPSLATKVSAAWALAVMSDREDAYEYVLRQADAILSNPGMLDGTENAGEKFAAGKKAIKYLGTFNTPKSKRILEAALNSRDPEIVQVATVNLIFNQGGSEKASQVVVQSLKGQDTRLGLDLAFSLAAQIDDPMVLAAGKSLDQSRLYGAWHIYTVERKAWPIYNWVDNYVVKLKVQ